MKLKYIVNYLNNKFIKKRKYYISIITTVKNEALYIKEWIEYHKLVGIEHFYIYNNNSDDNLEEVLKPYIDKKLVTYICYPGINQQLNIYNDAIKKFKYKNNWLAIIDLDEFILLPNYDNISIYLKKNENFSQLYVPSLMYGSSKHIKKPEGLVIENFKYRKNGISELKDQKYNYWGKSIVNPRQIKKIAPHFSSVIQKTKIIDFEEIRINHYAVKSYEEFFGIKSKRGDVLYNHIPLDEKVFRNNDINEVFDDLITKKYLERLKENMK